jgi:DNA-binding response OmpR family regulator
VKITGIELALAIKRLVPHCSILIFAGQTSGPDLLKTAGAAADELTIVTKPLHPKELVARVLKSTAVPNIRQSELVAAIPFRPRNEFRDATGKP